ncbi:hypothetical protein C8R44DRAFT_874315 [Mycena epipterygia]|nr:hypothetical protein C8R44DRAFT_874315 [Mycena epipterygia]
MPQGSKLLSHVIRLHRAGVQHNDLEPRNVTISHHSGPLIIDFDNATQQHVCPDLGAELSRPIRSTSPIPLSYLWIIIITFLILWMVVRSIR